jgi:hypothetical protein
MRSLISNVKAAIGVGVARDISRAVALALFVVMMVVSLFYDPDAGGIDWGGE